MAARVVNFCVMIGRKALGITSPFQPTDDMKDIAWSFAYANARDFAGGRHGICYAHMKMVVKKHEGMFIDKKNYIKYLSNITKLHDVGHAQVMAFHDYNISKEIVCAYPLWMTLLQCLNRVDVFAGHSRTTPPATKGGS